MSDALASELAREAYKDLLRDAERSRRLLRAKTIRGLPAIVRTLLMILA